jgi:FKBP-type peptidyl-prolyl cis-trans isomerase FkpA
MRPLSRRLFVYLSATLALAACHKPQRADNTPAEQPAGAELDKDRRSPHIERVTLASGLVIEDLQIGSGDICLPDSKVRVHYTCHLPDAPTVVDSSGDEPVELLLPRMIRGWRDGLPGMKVGGRRRLTVPPDLGYGSRSVKDAKGNEVIPPGSTLVYEIDLLGLVAPTPDSPPPPPSIPESPATSNGG